MRPTDPDIHMNEVTRILSAIEQGDPHAAEHLLPLVYEELRKLTARKLAQETPGQTLEPTALVHEAYLRLVASASGEASARCDQHWDSRGHFFAAAAEAMRRILVEAARRKGRIKHGGQAERHGVDLDGLAAVSPNHDVLDLHEALEQLAIHDPIKAKLVELRFFTGLTLPEAAAYLGISPSTADRTWRYARAWLYAAMDGDKKNDPA
jgi:RNA polymerase sigma factor (TIGR02999 family)